MTRWEDTYRLKNMYLFYQIQARMCAHQTHAANKMDSRKELINRYIAEQAAAPEAAEDSAYVLPTLNCAIKRQNNFSFFSTMEKPEFKAARKIELATANPVILPIELKEEHQNLYAHLILLVFFRDYPKWFDHFKPMLLNYIETNPLDDVARQYLEDAVNLFELENEMLLAVRNKLPENNSKSFSIWSLEYQPLFTYLSEETVRFQMRKQEIELCLREFRHAYERMMDYEVTSLSMHVLMDRLGLLRTGVHYDSLVSYDTLKERIPVNATNAIKEAIDEHEKQIYFIKSQLLPSLDYVLK